MKTPIISSLAILALGLHSFAQAPVTAASIKLGKVMPAVVKSPEFQLSSGPQKRSKPADWLEMEIDFETKVDIEDLTFKFTVQFEKKLLDGEVTYVNIAKGRDHYAIMYVSPKAIDKLTGGKPMTGASIENVWVEVSKAGQVLGKDQHKPGPLPNVPHITGLVLNKDETPYAPLWSDRYEAIKKSR